LQGAHLKVDVTVALGHPPDEADGHLESLEFGAAISTVAGTSFGSTLAAAASDSVFTGQRAVPQAGAGAT
jgi:hypothetical protein